MRKSLQIALLKLKLAQIEKSKESFKNLYLNKFLDYEHLQNQLEEKDKEIKDLNTRIFISQLLQTPEEQRLKIIGKSCYQYNPNQDKISFCIEKLVNVQKYISDNAVYIEEERFGREISDFIDNQINELKGDKGEHYE